MNVSNIHRVIVNWNESYGNDPSLTFVLKRDCKLTPLGDFRWLSHGNLFYSVCNGEVQCYIHNRNDHDGYGSRKYHLHMHESWKLSHEYATWRDCNCTQYSFTSRFNRDIICHYDHDTNILTLTGPWSGGASTVSSIIGPIVSVGTLEGSSRLTIEHPNYYHKMRRKGRNPGIGTAFATAYTLEFVQAVIDVHAPHLELYQGDYGYYPVRKGDQPKNPRKGNRRVASMELSDEQSRAVES